MQFFMELFIFFIFRQGGRDGEDHQCVVTSYVPPTGDLAGNPSMYPDWELNQRPFGSQANAQSTEPHPSGLVLPYLLTWGTSFSAEP